MPYYNKALFNYHNKFRLTRWGYSATSAILENTNVPLKCWIWNLSP